MLLLPRQICNNALLTVEVINSPKSLTCVRCYIMSCMADGEDCSSGLYSGPHISEKRSGIH